MDDYQKLAYFRRSAYGVFLKDYIGRQLQRSREALEDVEATPLAAARVQALREVEALLFEEPFHE